MEQTCYQVKVLHYLNPHLIWVEVIPTTEDTAYRPKLFEQVGVYGVLPLEPSTSEAMMDLDSNDMCETEEWCSGVVSVMDELLLNAKCVWFSPMYEDCRTSIFDDNLHIYGKIVVLNSKGHLVDLSEILAKTNFAYYDENAFIYELTTFQLKTHINRYQTVGVIKALEKCYPDAKCIDKLSALKALTSIVSAGQELEYQLTDQTHKGTLKILPLTQENIKLTLERKQRDFQQCKDMDEVSIGRGTSSNGALASRRPGLKASDVTITSTGSQDPTNLFLNYKKTLLAHAKRNTALKQITSTASPDKSDRTAVSKLIRDTTPDLNHVTPVQLCPSSGNNGSKLKNVECHIVSSERHYETIGFEKGKAITVSQHIQEAEHCKQERPTSNYNRALLEENGINIPNTKTSKKYSPNRRASYKDTNSCYIATKKKSTEEPAKERLVAYGPPDINKSKLVQYVEPKLSYIQSHEDHNTRPSEVEDTAERELAEPRNSLKGLDSEIDYPISDKAFLKSKFDAKTSKKSYEAHADESVGRRKTGAAKEVSTHLSESHTRFVESKENPTFLNQSKPNPMQATDTPLLLLKTGVVMSEESKAESRMPQRNTLTSSLLKKKLAQKESIKQAHSTQPFSTNDSYIQSSEYDSLNSTLCGKNTNVTTASPLTNVLKKKLEMVKTSQKLDSSSTTSDTSQKDMSSSSSEGVKTKTFVKTKHRHADDSDSDESTLSSIVQKLDFKEKQTPTQDVEKSLKLTAAKSKNRANPFENQDCSLSKFIDSHLSPVLMVHTKQGNRIQPVYDLNDVNFTLPIHGVLKELSVTRPMTLQTITWPSILRGYSLFVVSPADSGKTLGTLPAVCRLVADFDKKDIPDSAGPIAIIVCATAYSIVHVERLCRRFLGHGKSVLSCYAGVDEKELMLSLLNGCDVFVCTPPALVRLLNVTDFGLDLRRLTTFVLDDCERTGEVYLNEIKFALIKIKEMLRKRADKLLKVQFIVASRIWCDFMENLVSKAPNPMICIGSFQECVLYSKSGMSVNFTKKELKTDAVMSFMRSIDASKRTVIVCRTDEEVDSVVQTLKKHNHIVFAGKNSETIGDFYNLNSQWSDYDVPLVGPVLVCCDINLVKLNTTNAHNLLHYSLPSLFSMFSRRFSVLIDNFPSTFKEQNETVKINILLDETNVEQLPKILHFIKRCTTEYPVALDAICDSVVAKKDALKAQNLVPICDNTMALGECPDIWHCRERHTLFKEYDEPKHWVPTTGHITFKILHYHSAIGYSARLIANIVNRQKKEYGQTYITLSFKMGLYYTKESNKRPHGHPNIGDICAVSIRDNFFERCQVIKVLSRYNKSGQPNYVLIKLIDEEKWERTRDVHLYYLPEELKTINTHIVQVKLSGVQPKDRDISFSVLAKHHLMRLTDNNDNIYMRAKVVMALSNTVFVDDLEACQDLSMGETVVRYDFNEELIGTHAVPNPDHVKKLQAICERDGVEIKTENAECPVLKPLVKELPKPRWAHLDEDVEHLVYFAWADNPDKFFIRLEKFKECLDLLTNDIEKYVAGGNAAAISGANRNDIVLAKFPDDSKYYRARIDKVLGDNKVKCFFVDHGDWRHVDVKDLREMSANLITKLPFQAIECRLIGIKPVGDSWSEYSTNWLCDQCYVGKSDDLKELYVKYFTKEIPECTGGNKYGIALIDAEVVINSTMIDYNLASENEEETEFLKELNVKRKTELEVAKSLSEHEDWVTEVIEKPTVDNNKSLELVETKQPSLEDIFLKKPLRSVPLVCSDDASDEWDIQFGPDDIKPLFKQVTPNFVPQDTKIRVSDLNVPALLPKIQEKTPGTVEKDRSVCSSMQSDYVMIPSVGDMIETLDSDDFSSPELPQVSGASEEESANEYVLRKPKVLWRQNEKQVSMKILLIGVEKYEMEIQARTVTFRTNLLDTEYGFQLDLYGVIHPDLSTHSSKGQYLYVKLTKVIKKSWMQLTQDSASKKWIVYDPDDITASSDEDEEIHAKKDTLRKIIANNDESDDEDEDMDVVLDDLRF